MRLRRLPQAEGVIGESPLVLDEKEAVPGAWRALLGIDPQGVLNLEIGMGRGKFLTAACFKRPEEGWLGLEMRPEMHFMALQRLKGVLPPNLRFLWLNAAILEDIFDEEEIDNIYLPFSDPWPKVRHAKRRLTHELFLSQYQKILAPAGRIIFKTDNKDFYLWSKDSFLEHGWQILDESDDLKANPDNDIPTEYEERYRRRGLPIYYLNLTKAKEIVKGENI